MAERGLQVKREVDELHNRKMELLSQMASGQYEGDAKSVKEELESIKRKEDELEARIDKELDRRKKIDKIGIPILTFALIAFVVTLIVTLIIWIASGSFPVIAGIIAGGLLLLSAIVVLIMKILNPDMRLF